MQDIFRQQSQNKNNYNILLIIVELFFNVHFHFYEQNFHMISLFIDTLINFIHGPNKKN